MVSRMAHVVWHMQSHIRIDGLGMVCAAVIK
jgi:hypothetical protein